MPDLYRGELVGLCSYIERSSPQNATAVANRLIDAIGSPQIFPRRFKVHSIEGIHAIPYAVTQASHEGFSQVIGISIVSLLIGRTQLCNTGCSWSVVENLADPTPARRMPAGESSETRWALSIASSRMLKSTGSSGSSIQDERH